MAKVESCEIKVLLVPDLKLVPDGGEKYQVWFLDRSDASLARRGVFLRMRLRDDGKTESTVKVDLARNPSVDGEEQRAEGDVVAARLTPNLSLSNEQDGEKELLRAVAGTTALKKLFSRDQEGLLARLEIPLDGLRWFGPIRAARWRDFDAQIARKICIEAWRLSVGEPNRLLLEASMRIDGEPDDLAGLTSALTGAVKKRGFARAADQAGKSISAVTTLATHGSVP